MRRFVLTLALGGSLCSLGRAQFEITATRVIDGLDQPVWLTSPPQDTERLFVVEKTSGLVRIIQDGALLPTPFLDLGARIATEGDQGLYCLAFHPFFDVNGLLYVVYSELQGDSIVESYVVSAGDPNRVDEGSATIVLGPIPEPGTNHNANCLEFGPDGMLYVSLGDGSCCLDDGPGHLPGGNAQSGESLHGKILRLDVDLPYPHIPPDNPYVGDPDFLDEIWCYGLRNPWRMSFDRATGDLYIGDVGENHQEEINLVPGTTNGGLNFGWRCKEGTGCHTFPECTCTGGGFVPPLDKYNHQVGCSITAGFVYRGCALPDFGGYYVFGDFCTGRVFTFAWDGTAKSPTFEITALLDPGGGMAIDRISSFGRDGRGELYVCDFADGEIYQIVSSNPDPDCNQNGVPDDCDIQRGTSCDADGNGIPDECEGLDPFTYCTGKLNSCGVEPTMAFAGTPSATASSGFLLSGASARESKTGLMLYSDAGAAGIPFSGGFLCVQPTPLNRTVTTVSIGSGPDCDARFELDMTSYAAGLLGGTPKPFLRIPGTQVNCQWWGRDTVALGTYLSNAVQYLICP